VNRSTSAPLDLSAVPEIAALLHHAASAITRGLLFEAGRYSGMADTLIRTLSHMPDVHQRALALSDYVHELGATATVFAGRESGYLRECAAHALRLMASP
jgi:hypothetical protein